MSAAISAGLPSRCTGMVVPGVTTSGPRVKRSATVYGVQVMSPRASRGE